MKTWLISRWADEAKFTATVRAALALLGALFAADVIPTTVPGLGPKLAAALNIIAFGMSAGDKTAQDVKDATAIVTGIPPEKQE